MTNPHLGEYVVLKKEILSGTCYGIIQEILPRAKVLVKWIYQDCHETSEVRLSEIKRNKRRGRECPACGRS